MILRSSILSLATATALLTTTGLWAQEQHPVCGTNDIHRQMLADDPHLAQMEAEAELGLQEYLQMKAGQRDDDSTTVYVIPIVFHILYDPTSSTDLHNVEDAAVYTELNELNAYYRKSNPELVDVIEAFTGIVADNRIEFRLATKDPLGNCTNGIDRITSLRSTQGGDFSKLDPWFRDRYLNIWVVKDLQEAGNPGILQGFSRTPSTVQDSYYALVDGVIVVYGSIGTGSTTLPHEIGHFLNLQHPWGSTNDPAEACGDDDVEDTPITKGSQFTCYLYDFTCSDQALDTVYTFTNVTTTSGTTDPTPVPTIHLSDTLSEGLVMSPVKASGVSSNSVMSGEFAFTGWGTGAQDEDSLYADLSGTLNTAQYYEFTVTPVLGKAMTLTGITFDADRTATGPRTFAVRSSYNSYATNLTASVSAVDSATASITSPQIFFFMKDTTDAIAHARITVSGAGYTQIATPVTFRIYGWNAEDGAGAFVVDNLTLEGRFGIIENVQNIMDYSTCSYMFTDGQADRMRATLNSSVSSRNNLPTESNHSYTGIEGYEQTCGPQAGFYTMTPFVCANTSVQFKDNSTKATPTSWAWSFEGGTPATSTEKDPTVTFTGPGAHAVTLTVGNDVGSSTVTLNAVTIGADYSETPGLLSESFNTMDDFWHWPTVNYENNLTYWAWNGDVGHNSPGSAKLNASLTYSLAQDLYPPNNFKDVDLLVTPTLDLQFGNNMELSFWVAYATQTSVVDNITERLKVWSSTDCGKTWLMRKDISGGELVTAGIAEFGYTPQAEDWRQFTIPVAASLQTDHVRFKFEYTSGLFSNDLYIDDINISGNVGIDELAQSGSLALMPNPATDHLSVEYDLGASKEGTISFVDMTGRTLFTQQVVAGSRLMEFDLDRIGLSSGVYLVQLKHGNGQRVERLVVR